MKWFRIVIKGTIKDFNEALKQLGVNASSIDVMRGSVAGNIRCMEYGLALWFISGQEEPPYPPGELLWYGELGERVPALRELEVVK